MHKYVNRVDLVNKFRLSIYFNLQKSASTQPRTSLSKSGGNSIHSFIRLLTQNEEGKAAMAFIRASDKCSPGSLGSGAPLTSPDKKKDADNPLLTIPKTLRIVSDRFPTGTRSSTTKNTDISMPETGSMHQHRQVRLSSTSRQSGVGL